VARPTSVRSPKRALRCSTTSPRRRLRGDAVRKSLKEAT
jgi:hypothetical protein